MNDKIKIAWFGKHFGEEPPFVGNEKQGAGGIFFAGCNLRCCFCQNYQISQENLGDKFYSIEELSGIMIDLQSQNCVCIDLVTPTIWYEQIKEAILIAKNSGLTIPIIWNSNGYEDVDIIKDMNGLVDIYLPDFKYSNNNLAFKYSLLRQGYGGQAGYVKTAITAIKEMYNQVGLLKFDKNNLAKTGIVIRHLILPNNIENSFGVLDEIAKIDRNIHVSLMSQYNPVYNAKNFEEINRKLTQEEFNKVYDYQLSLGMENGWYQELDSSDCFVPDFERINPFIVAPDI